MVPIVSLLSVVVLSLICVRVGTVALVQTGLSDQLARFQARSAFTTAGYTTAEAEQIMSHPLRRRIVGWLMLAGNVGLVSVVSSLVPVLMTAQSQAAVDAPLADRTWFRLALLAVGLGGLWVFSSSEWVDRRLSQLIGWMLTKYTDLELRDYEGLLHMTGGYIVAELRVDVGDWLAGQTLIELALTKEGVLILGIEKPNGIYIGAPQGHTMLEPGDSLLVYGLAETLDQLDHRRRGSDGNREHEQAVSRQQRIEELERRVLEASDNEERAEVSVELANEELDRLRREAAAAEDETVLETLRR